MSGISRRASARNSGGKPGLGGEGPGEGGGARADAPPRRGTEALADGRRAAVVGDDPRGATDRVRDRTVARAPADAALHRAGGGGPLLLGQRRRRHDHARGAEAALKSLRGKERG